MLDKAKNVWYSTSCSAGVAHLVERHLAKVEVASSSLVARSKKEVTTYVVTSFLDSGRKLKCSGEVNSPSAKVLLRKTLVRRKSAGFLAPAGRGANRARAKRENARWGVCRPLCVSRHGSAASEPRRPLQKRGHNVCCDLFFGFRQEIKMLGRSEFALRQGFAAQNACTAQKRRFFGFRQEIKMLGRSEFALRQGFAAQNACTAQKRCFLLR